MIKTENFPKAYSEISEIIKYMDKADRAVIPNNFIDMIESKKNNEYKFKLDENKQLENQTLMRETRAILAYIFINYLSTPIEKQVINKKFNEDILKEEKLKSEKYSSEVVFKSNKDNQKQLVEVKKEKLIDKIFNFLNRIFRRDIR